MSIYPGGPTYIGHEYDRVSREALEPVKAAYDVWVTPHALIPARIEDLGAGLLLIADVETTPEQPNPSYAFVCEPQVNESVSCDRQWTVGLFDETGRVSGSQICVNLPVDTPADQIADAFRGFVLVLRAIRREV